MKVKYTLLSNELDDEKFFNYSCDILEIYGMMEYFTITLYLFSMYFFENSHILIIG